LLAANTYLVTWSWRNQLCWKHWGYIFTTTYVFCMYSSLYSS